MKKTLTLLALLGSITTTTQAAVYWTDGLDERSAQNYTFTKYAYSGRGSGDEYMCFAISACNTLAWWQDRVELNGAVIIPDEAPRGEAIWDQVRTEWKNLTDGGQPNRVLQYYLTGYTGYSNNEGKLTDKGLAFIENTGGYYQHLLGARFDFDGYIYPDECMFRYVDANGWNSSDPKEYEDGFTSYQGASKYLVELLEEGYGGVLKAPDHVMSFYAVETNEEGLITKIWYNDNNYDTHALVTANVSAGTPNKYTGNDTMAANVDYGNTIRSFSLIRTKGIQFDRYDLTMTGGAGDEALFTHYLNLTIDGHQDYQLKYDLRNALDANSPVNALGENGERISTGDISLKSGKLSLIACDEDRVALDGGGKTSGTISFERKDGAIRTLSVQHSDTIAAEIHIGTADGNTLEVTDNNIAKFGKLTGDGNLAKTGTGTAEVTEEVSLKGSIDVKQGKFILGVNATLSADTVLTVAKEAHMESSAEKAVTLTINSGVHTNDGEMTLTTTVNTGATLKGSGTFGKVTIAGGEMIVGNSPGHQEYTDSLTLSSGKLVFCVSGFDDASEGDNVGWTSGTYSTINMNGNELVINEDGQICIDLGGSAANGLPDDFCLTLVTGMANPLTEAQLAKLAQQTTFRMSDEEATLTAMPLGAPDTPQFAYKMSGNALVLTAGASDNGNVPEPATSTLSLLALASLCKRRRRK